MSIDAELKLRHEADLRKVLGTVEGRRVVWWVMDELAGVYNRSFAGEATHQAAFSEGKRWVGTELVLRLQRLSPTLYTAMLVEAEKDRASAEVARALEEKQRKEAKEAADDLR